LLFDNPWKLMLKKKNILYGSQKLKMAAVRFSHS